MKVKVKDHQVLHKLIKDNNIEKINDNIIKIENVKDYEQKEYNNLKIKIGKNKRKYQFHGVIKEY